MHEVSFAIYAAFMLQNFVVFWHHLFAPLSHAKLYSQSEKEQLLNFACLHMFYPCSCQTVHLHMGLFPKSGQKAGLLNMFGKHSSQDHSFKLCNENLTKEFILGLRQGRANLQTYIVFVSHQAAF